MSLWQLLCQVYQQLNEKQLAINKIKWYGHWFSIQDSAPLSPTGESSYDMPCYKQRQACLRWVIAQVFLQHKETSVPFQALPINPIYGVAFKDLRLRLKATTHIINN